ncbi:hypothetical protein QBC36DRAFT_377408 [Triangularia setosa]|uniref:DUF7726 domain-containing protein n=1 Tax=Triangularia setosa TaxID=2587417 RepID=A0AAN7A8Z5_9PEZI|nr:hypothetical protein QBC36DRAFT_377408 [Podospora setosa]
MNCDQVRRKINNLLDSVAIIKTAFAREIGVSAKSLSGFLGIHGPFNGSGFVANENASIAAPASTVATSATAAAPKTKTPAASATTDISTIHLPGEETDSVPIFGSCDEFRCKINLHLKRDGATQTQLHGPSKPGKCFQSVQLQRFCWMKGSNHREKSALYYGAYVFF